MIPNSRCIPGPEARLLLGHRCLQQPPVSWKTLPPLYPERPLPSKIRPTGIHVFHFEVAQPAIQNAPSLPADKFYLVRSGKVALYIEKPREIIIQTIHDGDILGWSWLVPPYRYRFSAKASENTRALALDGKCLREKCESNSDLGYQLLKRLVNILTDRLEATRLQLLDIYNIEHK